MHLTHKRPFLLLEVLISLTLVLLILGPLIKPLCGIAKAQGERADMLEMERAFRALKLKVKEKLYTHQHHWEDLAHRIENQPLGDHIIGSKVFKTHYSIDCLDSHAKRNGDEYFLCSCVVVFTHKNQKTTFSFPFLLEKRENS